MLRRTMALLLTLFMVFSVVPASVFATEEESSFDEQQNLTDNAEESESAVEVGTYDELVTALANGGEIKLTADITVDTKITVIDNTVIDLNSKTLYINVENSYYNNATIKNGNIVLGKDDVHVCDGYFKVNEGKTLILNNVKMGSSSEGIIAYSERN